MKGFLRHFWAVSIIMTWKNLFMKDGILHRPDIQGTSNIVAFRNKEADKIIEELKVTFDKEKTGRIVS